MTTDIKDVAPAKAPKKLSLAGLIRVCIELRLEKMRGKRVNISGPHYRIVQAVAACLEKRDAGAKSFSGSGLHEMRITLRQCLDAIETAIDEDMYLVTVEECLFALKGAWAVNNSTKH